ncbi:MAG: hypothetical protein LAT67_02750 [Balneolales bacterium]|nr:hypothetical protein [Balneolales bacterium]
MNKKQLLKLHLAATMLAGLTITIFLTATVVAEISRETSLIVLTKKYIAYFLPVLIFSMPALAGSGIRLAKYNSSPLIRKKLIRMKIIGVNGLFLVTIAIYLYLKSSAGLYDDVYRTAQAAEIILGSTNLLLIAQNAKAGFMMSRDKNKPAEMR